MRRRGNPCARSVGPRGRGQLQSLSGKPHAVFTFKNVSRFEEPSCVPGRSWPGSGGMSVLTVTTSSSFLTLGCVWGLGHVSLMPLACVCASDVLCPGRGDEDAADWAAEQRFIPHGAGGRKVEPTRLWRGPAPASQTAACERAPGSRVVQGAPVGCAQWLLTGWSRLCFGQGASDSCPPKPASQDRAGAGWGGEAPLSAFR